MPDRPYIRGFDPILFYPITIRLAKVTHNSRPGSQPSRYVKRMRDSEVVASIAAGDPLGLAAAYDRYSGPLFGYCQTLLDEPADAADAVQDTFVIAASKLTTLRDPERLRAWLFAVARNECLHRLKSRQAAAPLADAEDRADDSADVSEGAERAEVRALIRAAVGGLNAGERDVINQLWHGLEVREVAAVLGVSRNHAYSLFSRALDQLETSVAVLLVGRAGRKDCAALDQLLIGWDGRLTAPLRKRVGRHIDRCPICSDRRKKALTPAVLFDLTPAAILAFALARAPLAGLHLALPTGLRGEVLRLATDPGQHAAAFRAGVTRSTGPFHANGFPRAAHVGHLGLAKAAHLPFAAASGTAATATATVAVTATAVVTAIMPSVHPALLPGGGAGRGTTVVQVPSAPAIAPRTEPAVRPATRQTPQAVHTLVTATAKHGAHKAKHAGHPDAWRPAGHGAGQGNWIGRHRKGNGDHNGYRHDHEDGVATLQQRVPAQLRGHNQGQGNGHTRESGYSPGNSNAEGNRGQGNKHGYGHGNGHGYGKGNGPRQGERPRPGQWPWAGQRQI